MERGFHRDKTAKIYNFVPAERPASGDRIEPRLLSAEIVPMRADIPVRDTRQAPEPLLPYADFGSGWYHDVAIEKGEPFKH